VSKINDPDFIRLYNQLGAEGLAKQLDANVRGMYARRRRIERNLDIKLVAPTKAHLEAAYPHRLQNDIQNGTVLIGSDFHIWPGQESLALKCFKKFADDLRPSIVILNGDVLDFPQISKHSPIGWESAPSPQQEIEAAQDHLQDIAKASKRARKVWHLGNHDARFETRLATVASEYKGIKGIHLSDHFGLWEKGWSSWINKDIVVKHRYKGGIHAAHNNTLWSGKTLISGHLHAAKVTPFTDYNGTRWGVDTGCVADTDSKQFVNYTEDNPLNWISAFGVLTFKDGRLLPPELVTKFDDKHMTWRGQLV
jgi:UDP-2,3-diacylglucosamine pyrophosphatase LpxH